MRNFRALNFLSTLIGFVFPQRESFVMVSGLRESDVLTHYSPREKDGFTALTAYTDPVIRALIKEAKFHRNEQAFRLLARLLGKWLAPQGKTILIIPIPLSKEREKERGYNQVTEVLKLALKDADGLELRSDILHRVRDTKPQTSMQNKEERIKNIEDAFGVRDHCCKDINGADIILIDDVATTGATLKAARLELQKHKLRSITCLALAH